jgi:O-antigen/teichoic acid export membrane protein
MITDKRVLSGIGMMAALTITSKLVRLVILMVTARFLTPEDFGVVAAFSLVLGFAYLIADMGLNKAIIQKSVLSAAHISGALSLSIALCVFIMVLLIFASEFIANLVGIDGIALPLQIASFMFLFLSVSNISSAILQRNGEIVFIGKVQAVGTLFGNIFVTIPLLWFDVGYWSIIIGLLVSELIPVVIVLWRGRSYLKFEFSKNETVEMLTLSSGFMLNNILGLVGRQADIAIVGRVLGASVLGSYSRAMQLIDFPLQMYWLVIDRVVYPAMSAMKADSEKLNSFFWEAFSILLVGLSLGSLVLFVGAEQVVLIIMGDDWSIVAILLETLSFIIVLRCLTSFMDSFLSALGTVKLLNLIQSASLILLLLSIWMVIDYGIEGVAVAVVFTALIRFIISVIITIRITNISTVSFSECMLPAVLSTLIVYGLNLALVLIGVTAGLVAILTACFIWLIVVIIFPHSILISNIGNKIVKILKDKAIRKME